jgi:hypothetical protein
MTGQTPRKIWFFCNFRVKFMRLTKQRSPASTRNSAALEEVTVFCVRPLCARSSRPAAKRKIKACDFCTVLAKTLRHEGHEIFRASS